MPGASSTFRLGLFDRGEDVLVMVLGTRVTKAVHVRRKGQALVVLNYALADVPLGEKGVTSDLLAAHFRAVRSELQAETNRTILVLGMAEVLLRNLEVPPVSRSEMRRLVKQNAMHFLQQDLADFELDCCLFDVPSKGSAPGTPASGNKKRILVGGAKIKLVEELLAAAKAADLALVQIQLSQVSLVNAALLAMSGTLKDEVVALVNLGFRSSTISFVVRGELGLTRVVNIGGERFTARLAEAFGVPFNVAEGLKTVMPEKVQAKLLEQVTPLGRELRDATDFFESQHEDKVVRAFVSGGTSRSDLIVQSLGEQLGMPCEKWDAISAFVCEVPKAKEASLAKDGAQLTAALGAAAAWQRADLIQLDLLAGRTEQERLRRRNPVRKAALVAGVLVLLTLAWAGQLGLELWMANSELVRSEAESTRLLATVNEIAANLKRTGEIKQTAHALEELATDRFLWVLPLNSLQYAMVEGIQVTRINLLQEILQTPGTAAVTKSDGTKVPAKPPVTRERLTLIIRAKNSGPPAAIDRFIETIAAEPYFAKRLRRESPVILKERNPPQIDPLNPANSFVMFTLECFFAERTL